MNTISTQQLCEALHLSKSRLGQWTSRGFLSPQEAPRKGPSGYGWTLQDAIKAGVFARLMEIGIGAETAASAIRYLHGLNANICYLVISTGKVGRIIPTSEGEFVPSDEDCSKVNIRGYTVSDLVRGADLGNHLSNEDFHASVVVNIDSVENLLSSRFSA